MNILCIGDSHSRLLGAERSESKFRYNRVCPVDIVGFKKANVLAIKGATAAGFRPRRNKRSSYNAADQAITEVNPDLVCFGFGQVDAELSCYFIAFRDGCDLETALQSRIDMLEHYLFFCREAVSNRPFLVKGLNTVTLQSKYRLYEMLLQKLPEQLGTDRSAFSDWLEQNEVGLTRHREINTTITKELRAGAGLLGIPYFDVRDRTSLPNQPGLTKPEYCGRKRNIHLNQSKATETLFSEVLSDLARKTLDNPRLDTFA